MKSIEIDNIKKFTTALFAGETFDGFCVTEASFSTLFDTNIDGHINPQFLSEGEEINDNSDESVRWKKLRPLCYEIIKGQRVPLKFRIVFIIPKKWTAEFIAKENLNYNPADVNGLFLNIRFEEGKLSATTGTSLKSFSLDKSLDEAWDRAMAKFLNSIA